MARVWTNWAALFAASAGAFLLSDWAITVEPGVQGVTKKVLAIQAAVMGVGLLLQMIRSHTELNFFAPAFYLSGVTFFLFGPVSGSFAIAVGWLFAVAQKDPTVAMPVAAIALGIGGYLLAEGPIYFLALNVALLLGPTFVSLLFQKPLLMVSVERARLE